MVTIYTYGDASLIKDIFQGLAAFADSGGWLGFIKMVLLFGVIFSGFYYLTSIGREDGHPVHDITHMFVVMLLAGGIGAGGVYLTYSMKENVQIIDQYTGDTYVVERVPFAVAKLSWIVNSIGRGLGEVFDTFFMDTYASLNPEQVGIDDISLIPNRLRMLQFFQCQPDTGITSNDCRNYNKWVSDLKNFISVCVAPYFADCEAGSGTVRCCGGNAIDGNCRALFRQSKVMFTEFLGMSIVTDSANRCFLDKFTYVGDKSCYDAYQQLYTNRRRLNVYSTFKKIALKYLLPTYRESIGLSTREDAFSSYLEDIVRVNPGDYGGVAEFLFSTAIVNEVKAVSPATEQEFISFISSDTASQTATTWQIIGRKVIAYTEALVYALLPFLLIFGILPRVGGNFIRLGTGLCFYVALQYPLVVLLTGFGLKELVTAYASHGFYLNSPSFYSVYTTIVKEGLKNSIVPSYFMTAAPAIAGFLSLAFFRASGSVLAGVFAGGGQETQGTKGIASLQALRTWYAATDPAMAYTSLMQKEMETRVQTQNADMLAKIAGHETQVLRSGVYQSALIGKMAAMDAVSRAAKTESEKQSPGLYYQGYITDKAAKLNIPEEAASLAVAYERVAGIAQGKVVDAFGEKVLQEIKDITQKYKDYAPQALLYESLVNPQLAQSLISALKQEGYDMSLIEKTFADSIRNLETQRFMAGIAMASASNPVDKARYADMYQKLTEQLSDITSVTRKSGLGIPEVFGPKGGELKLTLTDKDMPLAKALIESGIFASIAPHLKPEDLIGKTISFRFARGKGGLYQATQVDLGRGYVNIDRGFSNLVFHVPKLNMGKIRGLISNLKNIVAGELEHLRTGVHRQLPDREKFIKELQRLERATARVLAAKSYTDKLRGLADAHEAYQEVMKYLESPAYSMRGEMKGLASSLKDAWNKIESYIQRETGMTGERYMANLRTAFWAVDSSVGGVKSAIAKAIGTGKPFAALVTTTDDGKIAYFEGHEGGKFRKLNLYQQESSANAFYFAADIDHDGTPEYLKFSGQYVYTNRRFLGTGKLSVITADGQEIPLSLSGGPVNVEMLVPYVGDNNTHDFPFAETVPSIKAPLVELGAGAKIVAEGARRLLENFTKVTKMDLPPQLKGVISRQSEWFLQAMEKNEALRQSFVGAVRNVLETYVKKGYSLSKAIQGKLSTGAHISPIFGIGFSMGGEIGTNRQVSEQDIVNKIAAAVEKIVTDRSLSSRQKMEYLSEIYSNILKDAYSVVGSPTENYSAADMVNQNYTRITRGFFGAQPAPSNLPRNKFEDIGEGFKDLGEFGAP